MNVAARICKVWLHPQWLYDRTAAGRRDRYLIDWMMRFARDIRVVKQAERERLRADGRLAELERAPADDGAQRPPQLFVNEMLKMHDRGEIGEQALDEQLVTMIVGVSRLVIRNITVV